MSSAEPPEPIEGEKNGGRVGTAAPHARLTRNALLQTDFRAEAHARRLLQGAGRPNAEVLFYFAHDVAHPNNGAVFAQRDVDRVAEVDQNEGGLQKVLSVGTAARHVQKEVELCRGGQAEKGFRHGFGVSRRRVRRILAPRFS